MAPNEFINPGTTTQLLQDPHCPNHPFPQHQVCHPLHSQHVPEICLTDITVGNYYDPHLLPDYGSSVFRLINAMLIQQDIVNTEENLIPPWETYNKLQPDTIVLMKVQLMTFKMPDQDKDGIHKVRLYYPAFLLLTDKKAYQFLVECVRVLAHSEDTMEIPDGSSRTSSSRITSLSTEHDATDDVLDNLFASKKLKLSLNLSDNERHDLESSSTLAATIPLPEEHAATTKHSASPMMRKKAKEVAQNEPRCGGSKGKEHAISSEGDKGKMQVEL